QSPRVICLSSHIGYQLCKHSLISEVEQEELRTEEKGIFQSTFEDWETQLKDSIPVQNVPGNTTSNGIKMVRCT
uniref:Uncharacterized protein n=1 Tax=Urocitellus parryii TaxID=9999 RepID=A0A8D2KP34_UROPR